MVEIKTYLFLLLAASLFAVGAAEPRLAENGVAKAEIVVPDAPTPVEKSAAAELAEGLEKVTGAKFPVVAEAQATVGMRLYVGATKVSRARRGRSPRPTEADAWRMDEVLVDNVDDGIVLDGHPDRGPIYAVDCYLERELGVRWWTSKAAHYPKNASPAVKVTRYSHASPFKFRETYFLDAFDPDFKVRSKLNYTSVCRYEFDRNQRIPKEKGGDSTLYFFKGRGSAYHSAFEVLPPKKYFDAHPEWYSFVRGKRQPKQLCCTNREMLDEYVRVTKELLRAAPDCNFIQCSQNDDWDPCWCEKCSAVKDVEGGAHGANNLRMANAVAEAIEDEFPNVWVDTFAYQYTRKAPKLTNPRANVLVRLCSVECGFNRPISDPSYQLNAKFAHDLQEWSKVGAGHLFVWDYVVNFSSYMLPHPTILNFADNVRMFAKAGAVGLFEQGDATCSAGEFAPLRFYLLSKLAWDPSLDENRLIDEFLAGYYGTKAAPHLKAYLVHMHEAAKAGPPMTIFHEKISSWIGPEAFFKGAELMQAAYAAAQADGSAFAERVRREKLSVDHAFIVEWDLWKKWADEHKVAWPRPALKRVAVDEWIAACKELKVRSYRETTDPGKIETYFEKLREESETTYPQKTIRFPGSGFANYGVGDNALVAGSCWYREDGGCVFDLSDPTKPRFGGGFKPSGLVTSLPIVIPGTKCAVMTGWRAATVIDFSDVNRPRILQTLAHSDAGNTANDIRLVGDEIWLKGDKECRVCRWDRTYGRAVVVGTRDLADFPSARPQVDPRLSLLPKELAKTAGVIGDYAFAVDLVRSSVRSFELEKDAVVPAGEAFYVYGLAALAVKDETAYVYSPTWRNSHSLLTLDLRGEGCVDFARTAVCEPPDGAREFFTMGMLQSGSVEMSEGRPCAIRSAANMCLDGDRVAAAESGKVRVWRRREDGALEQLSVYAPSNVWHLTGVALRDETLFVIGSVKTDPKENFLHLPAPEKSYLLSLNISSSNAVLLAKTEVPSAVACVLAAENILYVPGIAHAGGDAEFAVVEVVDAQRPKILECRRDLVNVTCTRIRRIGSDVFYNDWKEVKRLTLDDPRHPVLTRVYRSNRRYPPSVDDFAVANGKLYALSHSSLAVYGLDGEGAVEPEKAADRPKCSATPFPRVHFSYAKTAAAKGRTYVCRDALGLEIDGKLVRLPEGNAEAVIVADDGTAYVAAGVATLAVFTPDGKVNMARDRGDRWTYSHAYAKGVALSADGKTVYVDAGEKDGAYLAYPAKAVGD